MFVQVVRGVVAEPDAAMARLDHWLTHLAPTAPGWLGTTAGVTEDRELISLVRFASAADARRSSDRVEQGQWWAESVLLFTGDVSFDNLDDVLVFGAGGSDEAGAVELLTGQLRMSGALPTLAERLAEQAMAEGRGVIGGLVGMHEDGRFVRATYLCGERGVATDPTPGALGSLPSWFEISDLELVALRRLWLGSPDGSGRDPVPAAGRAH